MCVCRSQLVRLSSLGVLLSPRPDDDDPAFPPPASPPVGRGGAALVRVLQEATGGSWAPPWARQEGEEEVTTLYALLQVRRPH